MQVAALVAAGRITCKIGMRLGVGLDRWCTKVIARGGSSEGEAVKIPTNKKRRGTMGMNRWGPALLFFIGRESRFRFCTWTYYARLGCGVVDKGRSKSLVRDE